MDPFLSDRHARWHPVDLSLFPLRRYAPPPASLHHHEIPNTSPIPGCAMNEIQDVEDSTQLP